MILELLRAPWPWYVSGPLIGLFVPLLLVLGNKQLGMTASLRAICAATVPGDVEFFRYEWRRAGFWNVALGFGMLAGAMIAVAVLDGGAPPRLSPHARDAMAAIHLSSPAGLVPGELFSWHALFTVRGAISMIIGGFLVGFGSSYAGGCTSGHGVMGLATLQLPSAIALAGIFAGGLLTTFLVVPRLL